MSLVYPCIFFTPWHNCAIVAIQREKATINLCPQEFPTLVAMLTIIVKHQAGDAAYFYRYRYRLGIHTTDFASRHPRWRGTEITARAETTANAFEN